MIIDSLSSNGLLTLPSYSIDPRGIGTDSWAVGGAMITARHSLAGAGTQNEALAFGGVSPAIVGCTEEYNGSTWAAGGTLIARSQLAGFGTQNAALAAGGATPLIVTCVAEYNGTAWTVATALSVARYQNAGAGTQNAGIIFGGGAPTFDSFAASYSEEYDGTTWTSTNNNTINNPRRFLAGFGTQNNAVAVGGISTPTVIATTCTEEYNGTVWVTGNDMIFSKESHAAAGDSSNGVVFGSAGAQEFQRPSQLYNGNYWSIGARTIFAGLGGWDCLAGAGTQTSALAFGGATPTIVACTEEYTIAAGGTVNIPSSSLGSLWLDSSTHYLSFIKRNYGPLIGSWTFGGAMITNRRCLAAAGAGTQNASLAFGGSSVPGFVTVSCTEEYNGSTWATGGAMITGRNGLAGAGTQNAGLAAGGLAAAPINATNITEEYDGSVWTAGGNLINIRCELAGAGTQNAGIAIGGFTPGNISSTCTEEYDGTSWSAGGALITGRGRGAAVGIQNEALYVGGGNVPSSTLTNCTEEYNGTSWTAGTGYLQLQQSFQGFGIQNQALFAGGSVGPSNAPTGDSIRYNGISWQIDATLPFAKSFGAGAGSVPSGIMMGGAETPACTLEYTDDSRPIYGSDVWIAGPSLITGRIYTAGAGVQGGALSFGGSTPLGLSSNTEEYNGIVWANRAALNVPRCRLSGGGTKIAATAFGGISGSAVICTEEFTCVLTSTWFDAGAGLTNASDGRIGIGNSNRNILAVGGTSPLAQCTELYLGGLWDIGGALISGRGNGGGAGRSEAALFFGGLGGTPIASAQTCTEEYNGTTWSTGGAMITARYYFAGAGIQNNALAIGGFVGPAASTCTEKYDGTSWSAGAALINATYGNGAAGYIEGGALSFGGGTLPYAVVEEYYCNVLDYNSGSMAVI